MIKLSSAHDVKAIIKYGFFVRIHHPENITPLPVFDDIFEVKEI